MTHSFATILRDLAARQPDAPALTCGDETWTFRDLDVRSSQTAQALLAEGVQRGDRVGVLARNCAEYYDLLFACSKAGAILVGLNWRLSPLEIDTIVADATPSLIITGSAGEAELLSETARRTPGLRRVVGLGREYEAWRAGVPADDPGHAGGADDVALLLYTSGTTGLPKGAMLTNCGMSYSRRLGAEAWRMTQDSVNLVAMPMFHIGGCGYGSSTMLVGGHTVLMRDVSLPLIVEAMEKHRVTHAFFVPTVVQGLLEIPVTATADLSSLELLMYGASPIGEGLLRKALNRLSCDFMQAYGMTETSGTIVTLEPTEHRLDGATDRLRSCGRALPFVEIRITDPDSGEDVPTGEVGEIWVRSEMVMKGYWRNPKATADAIRPEGWLRTGDAAYRDSDGFIYLYDRYKDLIISGGENIYPAEVENALLSHPAVSEVGVIGIPHERWGETPHAIVVPRDGASPTEAELIAFARSRLAHYKCPTAIVFADALPRNASGKLLKRELRKSYRPLG